MALRADALYTADEYLARELGAEYKNEYIDGRIYAMAGASTDHIVITGNIFAELRAQLRGGPCRAYASEMRVRIEAANSYTYPDVVAVCGEQLFEDRSVGTLLNPTVIIEVLSDSTERYDRGKKFARYRKLASLREYILVAQDEMHIDHYTHHDDIWHLATLNQPEDALRLGSLGCEVPLSNIYEDVVFSE